MATKKKLLQVSGGGDNYWLATLGVSGFTTNGYGVAIDSSDNIIAVGQTNGEGEGNYDALVVKYSKSGTILWQKTLGDTVIDRLYGVTVDSSDNIYVCGRANYSSRTSSEDMITAKFNPDGTLSWVRGLGSDYGETNNSVSIDSSGNVITVGSGSITGSGSDQYSIITKRSSSGSLTSVRRFGDTNDRVYTYGSDIDSSDNIYLAGTADYSYSGNSTSAILMKYNSSLTLQWWKVLGSTTNNNNDYFYDVKVDSSGNPIACGYTVSQGQGGYDVLVAKYNSSGVLQWQKTYGTSSDDYGRNIVFDSSGNIYVAGYSTQTGNPSFIMKLNSSGVLQWAKSFDSTTTSIDQLWGIALDSDENIVVVGRTFINATSLATYRLPSDGGDSGTYGDLTIDNITLTEATATLSSLTELGLSVTNAFFEVTDITTSLTLADATDLVDDLTSI